MNSLLLLFTLLFAIAQAAAIQDVAMLERRGLGAGPRGRPRKPLAELLLSGRKTLKAGWNHCKNNKVRCIQGVVKEGLGLKSLVGKIGINAAKRLGGVIPDNKATRFITALGTGAGKPVKGAASLIINPLNSGRAAVRMARATGKSLMKNGVKGTLQNAATGVKNSCKGQDRATCIGKFIGGGGLLGSGFQKISAKAQKIATARGNKDNHLKSFGK
jgi:hypothetical protein